MNAGQPSRPSNVENIVAINQGRQPLTRALPELPGLTPDAFEDLARTGTLIVDMRDSGPFGTGHIPGAYNVQLSSSEWEQRLGWVIPGEEQLLLVAEQERDAPRAQQAAAFIGLDRRLVGYLKGGMKAWQDDGRPVEELAQIRPEALYEKFSRDGLVVLDVRSRDEWNEGHILDAVNLHYRELGERFPRIPFEPDRPIAVICASGYRSSIAASVLLRHGYTNLLNVIGGMDAWQAAGLPRVNGEGAFC